MIAPVFHPKAAVSPAVEAAAGKLMLAIAKQERRRSRPAPIRTTPPAVLERRERILRLSLARMRVSQIVAETGIPRETVHKDQFILRREGRL